MKPILRERTIPQIEIITGEDTSQLQSRINAALMMHPDCTDIDIRKDTAIIRYNITVTVQEPDPVESLPEEGDPAIIDHRIDLTEEDSENIEDICVQLLLPVPEGRHCCECANYTWGTGCQYRTGPIRPMDPACPMFGIHVGRYSDLEPDPVRAIEPPKERTRSKRRKPKKTTLPAPDQKPVLPKSPAAELPDPEGEVEDRSITPVMV